MNKEIKIGSNVISEKNPCFIIAEIGVNHNGDINLAKRMVDEALRCGANCVKFQTYRTERLVTKKSPKADYQLEVTNKEESQFDMLKKLELSTNQYEELIEYTKQTGTTFLSTPYNIEDIEFLEKLGVEAFKVASGQIVEKPFLYALAEKGLPVIISTGMAYLSEIDEAVRVFKDSGNENLILLQCTTNYPASIEDSNIRAMTTMNKAFDCLVGYSDHTENEISVLAAVATGATIIEKHFTLDKSMPGPDHSSSANPEEMTSLVQNIRKTELCLGNKYKSPSQIELNNSKGMRRSLVTISAIKKGDTLTKENIGFKRPASGLHPNYIYKVTGKKVSTDLAADSLLELSNIEW
jgi:N,N'-diacetyllegionaminate synthase